MKRNDSQPNYPPGTHVIFKDGGELIEGHVNGDPLEIGTGTYIPVWVEGAHGGTLYSTARTVYVWEGNMVEVEGRGEEAEGGSQP